MDNFNEKLNELKLVIGKEDSESRSKFDAIIAELQDTEMNETERKELEELLRQGLAGISASMDTIEKEIRIRDQIRDSLDILPLSYIAKHYFGKSASWLYQRINGNKVRGKVYTLNKEEIEIFNKALKEIGNRIGSLSISC